MTRYLATFLPASTAQTNGYLLVHADVPVIVSGLGGDMSGNLLSPLPVQAFTLPQSAPPLLAVQQAGHTVVLLWPNSAAGFILQINPDLVPNGGWQAVTNPPARNGNTLVVTNAILDSYRFYRLSSP